MTSRNRRRAHFDMASQTQTWDSKQYQAKAGYVAELGRPVLDLLAPRSGDRVLDLGCGDGVLSLEIARLGCDVLGIDASQEMYEASCAALGGAAASAVHDDVARAGADVVASRPGTGGACAPATLDLVGCTGGRLALGAPERDGDSAQRQGRSEAA